MSLLHEPPKDNYEFVNGSNVNEFMNRFNQPKQDMHIDDTPPNIPIEEIQEEAEQGMNAAPAKATGKLIASVIDNTLPLGLAILAKGKLEDYKASEDDRSELENALAEYFKLKGADIPPGLMIVILILVIYTTKIPQALQDRKINTLRAELEAEKAEIAKIRLELEEKAKEESTNE
jgi:hypothetical protein